MYAPLILNLSPLQHPKTTKDCMIYTCFNFCVIQTSYRWLGLHTLNEEASCNYRSDDSLANITTSKCW